jgi:UDP-glucose 4-epimerase
MKDKRILVTGAAGFIGSHIVNILIKQGYKKVYALDDLSGGFLENVNKKAKFTKLDLRNKNKTEEYIKRIKPQIVFHLAADATEGRSQFTPLSCTERNYLAHMNLLTPAITNGLEKFILTSSMSVYGSQKAPFSEEMPCEPEDIYGVSKEAMEKSTEILSKVHGFKYVIIRPHNVYGPGQNLTDPYRNVVAIFINCLMNNKNFFIYGDGEQKRAFAYIDDVAPYMVKAAFLKNCEGEAINIGPTEEYTINKLADTVLKVFFKGEEIPEKLKPKFVKQRPLEVKEAWCTVSKAKKLLGYKTSTTLEKGVSLMIDWARKKGKKKFRYDTKLEIVNSKTPLVWVKKQI